MTDGHQGKLQQNIVCCYFSFVIDCHFGIFDSVSSVCVCVSERKL